MEVSKAIEEMKPKLRRQFGLDKTGPDQDSTPSNSRVAHDRLTALALEELKDRHGSLKGIEVTAQTLGSVTLVFAKDTPGRDLAMQAPIRPGIAEDVRTLSAIAKMLERDPKPGETVKFEIAGKTFPARISEGGASEAAQGFLTNLRQALGIYEGEQTLNSAEKHLTEGIIDRLLRLTGGTGSS